MKRKPPGWPKYMEAKPLAGGIRYFWNAPTWARKRDCPIKSEALGIDDAAAKAHGILAAQPSLGLRSSGRMKTFLTRCMVQI
jgi:hypothetical protein